MLQRLYGFALFLFKGEVGHMKFDTRLITGMVLGGVIGLHYYDSLVTYMPLLVIVGIVMLLKILHN